MAMPSAMGCPLASTIANFLFGHFETIMLKKQTSDHLKIYARYMDDIFAVFENDNASVSFLEVFCSQHQNILYANEKSKNIL